MAINIPILTKFNPKGLAQAEKALVNFGKRAAQVALGATAAVGAIGAVSVREFANFDGALTKSLAIMGDVETEMRDEMAKAARQMALETTFSAEQAAESFFFLASAGLDAQASIKAMPTVAKFAQAGMFDMALATDLLTDAQSALGLTIRDDAIKNMENMARVSNVLVKANTLANASVEQFSTSLTTKAGAALRAVGKDVEEGVAVLAAFADQGIKGELAGTQLSIVLRDLTTKAIRNEGAFRRMGIEVFDSAGDMANLGDIIGDLETALGGMSDETQKATLLQLGFSDKSLGSLQALMGTSEAIKTYESELRNASGTTDEIANKQLQTFNAQMQLLKSRFEEAGITIGAALAPAIMDLVEQMTPLIDQTTPVLLELFEGLLPVIAEIAGTLPGFLEALIPIIPAMGDLALLVLTLIESLLPPFTELLEDLEPVITGLTGFLAENGEVMGALLLTFALFTTGVRIATGALALFTGGAATATGASSGLFGVLARHPFVAVVTAVLAGATALFAFRESIIETGKTGRGFIEGWAHVTYGIQWLTKTMVNGALGALELLHSGIRMVLEAVTNDIRKLGGMPPITLPKLVLPKLDITPLEEYRREAGLLTGAFDDMTFPAVDVSGVTDQVARQNRELLQRTRAAQAVAMINTPGAGAGLTGFQQSMGQQSGFYDYNGMTGFRSAGPTQQNTYNINVNAGLGVNGQRVGDDVLSIITRYEEEAGPIFQRVRYTGG